MSANASASFTAPISTCPSNHALATVRSFASTCRSWYPPWPPSVNSSFPLTLRYHYVIIGRVTSNEPLPNRCLTFVLPHLLLCFHALPNRPSLNSFTFRCL